MKEYLPILRRARLFEGIAESEIAGMLGCLQATVRGYCKGEAVLRQGDTIQALPLLLSGELHIQREDYWGNRHILGRVGIGELVGEAYAAPNSGALMSDVVATCDSTVMFFNVRRLLTTCSSACPFHAMVVHNLVGTVCEKNRELVQKLEHISQRTTREKLLSYLSEEARRQQSHRVTLPFNRQQLADYLSVDRSAMSKELCEMRDEGILRFERNRFELL